MTATNAFIRRYLKDYKPYKTYWNYEDGCVLKGCMDLFAATGDPAYRTFVLDYLYRYVAEDGTVVNYELNKYNIDSINAGKALFFGLDETGDERFRKAIEFHMQRLREHPRCACGNFWHKSIYPEQIWLDGLYMAQPFYMLYETRYNKLANAADITGQYANVRKYLFNEEKQLYYHACDTARVQPWADKETGCSRNFWLRSMGWYVMSLIDCIDHCSEMLYEHYRMLIDLFREAVRGLLRYQDADTGLFWQVIDHGGHPDNYLETSGSAMVAYAIMKGVRLHVLNEEKYLPIGKRIFEALAERKLITDDTGLHLCDICAVAGLSDTRDGSVAYYLSEPRVADDSKGVGPFMMAYAEYLRA
ncbi:MAG: glycosyl hydrolase family 88 [Clostridiales bacterium]|nr:glycosyl hydrolase family 88 [Clostridiales bacterium]